MPMYIPPTACPLRVYDTGRSVEHSQARFTCTEAFPSFEDVKEKVSCYFITKRFGLNERNYLLRDA